MGKTAVLVYAGEGVHEDNMFNLYLCLLDEVHWVCETEVSKVGGHK